MTITVPIVNKLSLNKIYGGVHYRTRKKHKDEYHQMMHYKRPQQYTGTYPVTVTYHYKFKGKRLDSSNCAYLTKLLEDALVACNVFPDDSAKYIYSTTNITDKGDNEVEITITPYENNVQRLHQQTNRTPKLPNSTQTRGEAN